MKIYSNKNKLPVIILIAVVLFATIIIGWVVFNQPKNAGSNGERQESFNENREQIDLSTDTEEPTSDPEIIDNDTTMSPNLNVAITSTNRTSQYYQVRSLITPLISNGECSLKLLKSGSNQAIEKTAAIQSLANSSTCKGFDIPIDQLTNGSWQLTLEVTSNDGKSGSVQKDFEVN